MSMALASLPASAAAQARAGSTDSIPVGILHSLTGTMALSERPVVESTLLAIEELNREGGLLGRQVRPIVRDGRSDATWFAREAEALLREDRVVAVFGCWTSASRKTVLPVFERHRHLLFYPVQYEGLEQSPNVVYTGAAPNQQIIPGVKWSLDSLGDRCYLVGSDYVFPHAANAIIGDQVRSLRGQIVAERYLPLGGTDVKKIVDEIVALEPDVILNTINGDSNIAFFRALRAAGVTPQRIPTVSFSIAEPELKQIGGMLAGDYAVWNYFQSIERQANKEFVARFKARYGADRTVSDPMEAAHIGVRLWAQAVRRVRTVNVEAVSRTIGGQVLDAPEGLVYVDSATRHVWKRVRVGRILEDGQFHIVWESSRPVRPIPFPPYRSKAAWAEFLDRRYAAWGEHWAGPMQGAQ